jgi:hypothetical protein
MGERVAPGHIEKDPRPTFDLGGSALRGIVSGGYRTSAEDALYMAYEGYPDVQRSIVETNDEQDVAGEGTVTDVQETTQERIARTRYVVSATPLNDSARRKVETLTTEAL